MKKVLLSLFFILVLSTPQVFADKDEVPKRGEAKNSQRVGTVMGRGFKNLALAPFELFRTPLIEMKEHPRIWPITFVPRVFKNVSTRGFSAIYDIFFYPLAMPFLDETPSYTEKMGLDPDFRGKEDEY